MIDFDALVLGPAMEAFARPITVTPLASQPGQPAFDARGIFGRRNIDVALEEGIMSSADITLGVRVNEFAVLPKQGDRVSIPAFGDFIIDDTDEDADGGSLWTLKKVGQ